MLHAFVLPTLALVAQICAPLARAQAGLSPMSVPLVRVPSQGNPQVNLISSNVSMLNSHGFAYLARMEYVSWVNYSVALFLTKRGIASSIGKQDFLMLLDTGSSDLWVVSSDCTEPDCQAVPKYSRTPSLNLSSTPFGLQYLLGAVSGTVGTETVTLGPFQISPQVFALANDTTGLGLAGTGNSGILGLSFPMEASIPDTSGTTLLENILQPFNDTNRFFAIKLGRDQNSSSFTVGGLDNTFANSTADLAWTNVYPVVSSSTRSLVDSDNIYDYWKIPLDHITVNGTKFPLSRSRVKDAPTPIAVFDTGTTLILGPSDDVDRLWTSIGGARKSDNGWQVRCDRGMVLGFALGTANSLKEYLLDPADLSWVEGGRQGDWCMGGIQSNDAVASGDWLLGDTFLRNVYIAHHVATATEPPKIGLLGMTDATEALRSFHAARGTDPTTPVPVLSDVTHTPKGLSGGAVCGISVSAGFVGGVLFMTALWLCLERYPKRHS